VRVLDVDDFELFGPQPMIVVADSGPLHYLISAIHGGS
jgi:hypothetical protein